MSTSINSIFVAGNVTKDPEVRTLKDGTKVAQFTVATSDGGYKKADGTDVPEVTQFHRIVAWRGLANLAESAITKGTLVMLEGKMTYRSWFDDPQNQQGRHDTAEIVADKIKVAGKAKEVAQESSPSPAPQQGYQVNNSEPLAPVDDLPF